MALCQRKDKGQAVESLSHTVSQAALKDEMFYELLTLVDDIRIGRAREKELARLELEKEDRCTTIP